jgi:hypothetical protein
MMTPGRSRSGNGLGKGRPGGMERRVAALEAYLVALADETRTRRLVVHDDEGRERIVAEVADGTAELRVELAESPGRRSAVVVVAGPLLTGRSPGDDGVGPAVALQVWADGDTVIGLDAWPGAGARWQPHFHVGEGS